MKLKKDLVLRQIADIWVVMPLGDTMLDLSGMLSLNETGAFLWECLERGADQEKLLADITAEYEVDPEEAKRDIADFLEKLRKSGCFEE